MTRAHWYDVVETPMGWIAALASEKGIRRLELPKASREKAFETLGTVHGTAEYAPDRFADLRRQLADYFAGRRDRLDVPLDMDGYSPFFSRAWVACASIPPGETRTYRWLAAQAGSPKAVRAAGQAMARNPVPLIIPCHRVVGSDGALHGYGGGLAMKARLLELERKVILA